ncbi:MAG: DUF2075 domain-containing protein, partial [Chloroflexi bacterium]|nr:DUF2075 domain-containing protein [Chloroflexota bacterium]
RLLASYGRPWVTKDEMRPHDLPPDKMDFHIPYRRDGKTLRWSRIWNFAPDADYELFVQAPPDSRMHDDPLSEVGCPYVVRGFDYDYVGVLWLRDLLWRDGRWTVDTSAVYESALRLTLGRAKKETKRSEPGVATEDLVRQIARGYRVLLSRALAGAYVWFEDRETREHVEGLLSGRL